MPSSLRAYLEQLTLDDGRPFKLLPWERRFIAGAFGVEGDAALSVARGNGKTALVAALACAVVDPDGPLHATRAEVVCIASSFSQGKIIFEDVIAFLQRLGHDLTERRVWRRQDSQNAATIEYKVTGARVRCIGSDPKRAHGLRPTLALLDEPSQWESARRDAMFAAMRTGLGKRPGSRLIALGTRPADSEHWFSKMLDGGAAYSQTHAARHGDPPFRVRTWQKANPSLPAMPDLKSAIRREADTRSFDGGQLQGLPAQPRAPMTWCNQRCSMRRHGKRIEGEAAR